MLGVLLAARSALIVEFHVSVFSFQCSVSRCNCWGASFHCLVYASGLHLQLCRFQFSVLSAHSSLFSCKCSVCLCSAFSVHRSVCNGTCSVFSFHRPPVSAQYSMVQLSFLSFQFQFVVFSFPLPVSRFQCSVFSFQLSAVSVQLSVFCVWFPASICQINEQNSTQLNWIECIESNRASSNWSELNWLELGWVELNWDKLDWIEMKLPGLNWLKPGETE